MVGHIHYVLFGSAIFALFAGLYFWRPKMFARMLSERLGKWPCAIPISAEAGDVCKACSTLAV